MIKRSFSARSSLRHDINVTPFVDVMLVLLVIFMVATPMMQSGVPIDLPQGRTGSGDIPSQPLALSLDKEGQIFLRDKPMSLDQVVPTLQSLPEGLTQRIYIHAHRTLPYERVMALISLLAAKGFTKVVLVTEPAP